MKRRVREGRGEVHMEGRGRGEGRGGERYRFTEQRNNQPHQRNSRNWYATKNPDKYHSIGGIVGLYSISILQYILLM